MDYINDDVMNIEDVNIKKDVSIVFMGTPEFAVPILEGLIDNYKVKAVVTQPDKPVGRDGIIRKSPIKEVAEKESCVIVGRCADFILKDKENVRKKYDFSFTTRKFKRRVAISYRFKTNSNCDMCIWTNCS